MDIIPIFVTTRTVLPFLILLKTHQMKKRIAFALALILMIAFTGCEKIKDTLTIKQNVEFTVNLPVTVGGEPLKTDFYPFSSTETLDPDENENIQQYKERIKSYELTGMTGTVSNLSTSLTMSDARLEVKTDNLSTEWTFTDLEISSGTQVTFGNDNSEWTQVNQMLESGDTITITFSGHTDQPGVVYTLILLFKADVRVRILG